MPLQPPLPHLLTPYVSSLPQSSLTVLSSVLGATGNWLVLRFLYAALNTTAGSDLGIGQPGGGARKKRKVVLVSFLRGWDFWKSEAKRLGLDLARLTEKGQFALVDGLSELFCPLTATTTSSAAKSQLPGSISSRNPPPLRPQQGHPALARSRQPVPPPSEAVVTQPLEAGPVKRLHLSGNGITALDELEKDITSVINQLNPPTPDDGEGSEVLLILDQPDLVLAAMGPSKGIGATDMGEWVMGLQQKASATILTVCADSPLIHTASEFARQTATSLEIEHAAFAVGLAHRAGMVMQLRNLETGAARDVSGVLRVSKGGAWGQRDDTGGQEQWEEKEVLYFVQRDGGVSVFGRGE